MQRELRLTGVNHCNFIKNGVLSLHISTGSQVSWLNAHDHPSLSGREDFVNKGVIVGCIYDADGNPYSGAGVKLHAIMSGRNPIKLRDTYAKGNSSIDMVYSKKDGSFGIPFFWHGVWVAEMMSPGAAKVSAIGRTTGHGSEICRINVAPDLRRLVTMLPSGLIGGGMSKFYGGIVAKTMPSLKGLEGAKDLLDEQQPAKHASTANLIAIGGVEIWLSTTD
tara:strand:+ start:3514 stop:4176 length:663 start_codon:yes stop_codon:yes gene_type:complete